MSSTQSQATRISTPIINSSLSKDQSIFQSLKNQCFKGTVKVICKYPANRNVDWDYVAHHYQAWGGSIFNKHSSYMISGLLPHGALIQIGTDNFLSSDIRVQVVHGQHQKIVLEMAIGVALGLISGEDVVQSYWKLEHADLQKIHAAKDAWWLVNLYDSGKSDSILKDSY